MKNIYVATIVAKDCEGYQEDKIIITEDIASAEAQIDPDKSLERIVAIDWLIADKRESYKGDYYTCDTVYDDSLGSGDARAKAYYLIQAESFKEVEEIAREEVGEVFEYVRMIEKAPWKVL